MKLQTGPITVNGRTKMKVWAESDTGERLPWGNDNADVGTPDKRTKMSASLVKELDCSEEVARAAVKKLYLDIERQVDAAAALPSSEPPETQISARLPDLVDVVANSDRQPVYMFITEAGLVVADHLDLDGVRHVPPELKHFPYKLPTADDVRGAFALDTDAALFEDLLEWHKRASKLPDEAHYYLLALWDLHTWIADRLDFSPHLFFESRDSERGKTRTGQSIIWVSYRGYWTETIQESNLFRWSDSLQMSLFIDVKDLWRKAEKRGSEDILLGRYQRDGAKVGRTLDPQADAFNAVRYFDVYGPTIIASNQAIPDPLASRGLAITPPEAAGIYVTLKESDAVPFKARGAAFRARHLTEPLPAVAKPTVGRLGDIMQPLGVVAAIVGGDLPDRFPGIVEAFRMARQSVRAETNEAQLVAAIVQAADEGHMVGEMLPTGKIADAYNRDLPEEYHLTTRQVGNRLHNLGFAGVPGVLPRARKISFEQLKALQIKFGVGEGFQTVDAVDRLINVGVAHAQSTEPSTKQPDSINQQPELSVDNPVDRHGGEPAPSTDQPKQPMSGPKKTHNEEDPEPALCAGCKMPLAVEDIFEYDDAGDPICIPCALNEEVQP